MPKKKLVIFPYNGNGLESLDCISFDDYDLVGFIDDDPQKKSEQYYIYSREILQQYQELFILAVPGSPATFHRRKEIISTLNVDKSRYITAIHPRATIGKNVKIGDNCLIMAGVVLTSNARINNHVCILPNTVIHHDAVIDDYTIIGSNVVIAGGTIIGNSCYIGSGTNIINNISIGDASLIGLGSNIIKNVTTEAKMVGNPARNLHDLNKLNAYNNQNIL
ncbi:NeuD/PglB/VioB family sugar acetyltransferase [Adhaeribacter radiodurans]|uniref:NeuD/PglB/VioB family sugar acetyltransferase n=1 Tax=Adhaeribacter radiodurans TaxID=2745197 RepID=A0A7L7L4Z8_9BACT|nr:NeuD/PglB/VioB family sugar acetyltransferase [Adhaeribacter radiodurans]QMU27459.1 NeuD/PglB/VioB family sugar acetyltransferase [Adhaeribacter radiodurans]